jgi:hypothetical protein
MIDFPPDDWNITRGAVVLDEGERPVHIVIADYDDEYEYSYHTRCGDLLVDRNRDNVVAVEVFDGPICSDCLIEEEIGDWE